METQGVGRSDVGQRRTTNEDSFVVDVDLGLYVVCDGMGGHAGGEVAAATAIAAIERIVGDNADVVRRVVRDPSEVDQLRTVGIAAIAQACADVFEQSASDPELAGMGCTATVMLVAGGKAAIAHVGDSRLYLIRQGVAHQLTSDHTLAAELVRQGTINAADEKGHPHAHILTRAVGIHALVDVESLAIDLVPGDRLVLCSDGLSDQIPSRPWLAERASADSLEDLPDNLIDFANAAGGPDNITVIAVGVEAHRGEPSLSMTATQQQLDVLARSSLFADLTLAQSARVYERCEAQTYEPGNVVWSRGRVVSELLVVTSGQLLTTDQHGRTAAAAPGQTLGETLIMRPRPIRATVSAELPTTILKLSRDHLLELAQLRPWLGVALFSRMLERISGEIDRSTNQSASPTSNTVLL